MKTTRALSVLTVAALLAAGLVTGAGAAGAVESTPPDSSYTSTDTGEGTYTVPVLNSDVPDVSVTLVPAAENDEGRDIYYMISTTMHMSPGAPIMKSYDMVNWETVSYVYDRISISDASSLRNGKESYGQGQWASSLRYHDGMFYVLFNTNNLGGAYLYRTDDVENGTWQKTAYGRGFHDPSLFFDDANGGTPYIFYGSGSTSAVQLSADLTQVVAEYPSIFTASNYAGQPFIGGLFEGAQVYRIGEYYYIFIITWPSGQNRQEVVFRSPHLLGRHQAPGGANTYEARSALNSNGFAQGGLVEITREEAESDWYGFFFRDTFPTGRIPALIPAEWNDGWPTFGDDGVVPYGGTFDKPIALTPAQQDLERQKSIVASDDFDNDAAHRPWMDEQWTIPDGPDIDESLVGVELFTNPGFEAGTTGWIVNDTATLTSASDVHGGTGAVSVTGRTTTGSGPAQDVSGKVQHGVTYDVSGWVKYDNPASPATKQFIMTARYGSSTFTNLANVTATRGQWARIAGSFTVPAAQSLASMRIFFETPWTSTPSTAPDTHLMDFLVDDVSLRGRPSATEAPHPDELAPNGSRLDAAWQWNHTPDNRHWSLTEREGWLSLTTGKVVTGAYQYAKLSTRDELTWFEEARNTLSQRTFGPKQSVETTLDVTDMKDGDVAGLAAFTRTFAYAGVKKVGGQYTLGIVYRGQPFAASIDQAAVESFVPGSTVALGDNRVVHLKSDLDFTTSGQLWVRYYYSFDGQQWTQLGQRTGPLSMDWSLSHFMGHRVGLFAYATQSAGGTARFDHFSLSKLLTADGVAVTGDRLDAAIATAQTLEESDYPAPAWGEFESALAKALAAQEAAETTPFSTHNQVERPARALERQIAELAVLAEASGPALEVSAQAALRCVAGKSVLAVTMRNEDDVAMSAQVSTTYGAKSVAALAAGKASSSVFTTRLASVPAGVAEVSFTATVDGEQVVATADAAYDAHSCG